MFTLIIYGILSSYWTGRKRYLNVHVRTKNGYFMSLLLRLLLSTGIYLTTLTDWSDLGDCVPSFL